MMFTNERKSMRFLTAVGFVAAAVYWVPVLTCAAHADDAPSRPMEIINSPAVQSQTGNVKGDPSAIAPAPEVRGPIEVIESPSARTKRQESADRPTMVQSDLSPTPLVAPSAPPVAGAMSPAPAPAPQPQTDTAQVPATASDATSSNDEPEPQRSLIRDPLTRNKAKTATRTPAQPARALPTLLQIEGKGAAHNQNDANKATLATRPARTREAAASSSPPPSSAVITSASPPQPSTMSPAASLPVPAPESSPSVQLHSAPRVDTSTKPGIQPATPLDDDATLQATPPALPAPTRMTSAEPSPHVSASPVPRVATDDDDDLVSTIKSYIPNWLGHLPADLALIGVLGLCVVLGLVAAGIRRSRETYD